MELIVIIILIIIIIAMGTYLWLLLRQIKQISEQLDFLEKNRSRLRINSELNNKTVVELIEKINTNIGNSHDLQLRLLQEKTSTQETIAGLSHDIRTPLTSLDGYLQLIKTTKDEKKQAEYIKIMQERVISLTRILDELFIYAKLQQETYELGLEKINLNEVLAHNIFSFYEDFKQNSIEPEVKLNSEDTVIFADYNAVNRVIQNILKNALMHGSGDLKIKLDTFDLQFSNQTLNNLKTELPIDFDVNSDEPKFGKIAVLEFSNKMKPDANVMLDQLFEKFYKADPSRQSSSTGLGLSIAKRLVEKMNGEIEAAIDGDYFILRLYFKLYNAD